MRVAYDVVIVGAGLSGLLLAGRLVDRSSVERRILVIDDGRHDIRARAWAYWSREPQLPFCATTAVWDAIAVHASGASTVLPIHPYRYVSLSGDQLHDALHERATARPHLEFRTGSATSVHEWADHAVITVDGAAVTARWAFDSRPVLPDASGPQLDFLGWEIDTAADAFDPTVATFMDFRGREPGTASFCYLLPTTARHALVEIAAFRWGADRVDLTHALTGYVKQACGIPAWSVTRTEAGSLPLARPPCDVRSARVVSIGVRGGMLKASTGFAVERIQRHSAAVVESLDRYGHPHAITPPSRRHAWLDDVFLEVLRRDPDIVEEVMARLFSRNDATAVLRFLDEDSTALQEARLIATLPVPPFLSAAIRRPRGSLDRPEAH